MAFTSNDYSSLAKQVYNLAQAGSFSPCTNFMAVSFGDSEWTLGSFTKVPFSTLTYALDDPGNNFSTTDNWYTVPVTGLYLVITKLRLNDNVAQFVSYGQGADLDGGSDSAEFGWYMTNATTNYARNGSLNLRVSHFTVGDRIVEIAYGDQVAIAAALTVIPLC